jgi:hypothetical protein
VLSALRLYNATLGIFATSYVLQLAELNSTVRVVRPSQHEDSFQLEFEVVNAVTVNISDAARNTQTRQRSGISSGRRIQEVSRRRF